MSHIICIQLFKRCNLPARIFLMIGQIVVQKPPQSKAPEGQKIAMKFTQHRSTKVEVFKLKAFLYYF